MSNLSNQQINSSFSGLLQIPGGITSSLQNVQDGNGNATGLSLSTSGSNIITSSTFIASDNGTPIPNAVARRISDGFGDYLSVKDFGAVGNGISDDTSAVQNAISFLTSKGNGILFFPTGTYNVSSPIVITVPITLVGEGATRSAWTSFPDAVGTKIKYTGSSSINFIQFNDVNNGSHGLENMSIDGGTSSIAVSLDSVCGGYYKGVNIYGFSTAGLSLKGTTGTCSWNSFINLTLFGGASGTGCIWLQGFLGQGNACHNSFQNIAINFYGSNNGINLGGCDNNAFFMTYIYCAPGSTGYGVIVDPSQMTNFPINNTFFHLEASTRGWYQPATTAVQPALIYGYMQDNGQPGPITNNTYLPSTYSRGNYVIAPGGSIGYSAGANFGGAFNFPSGVSSVAVGFPYGNEPDTGYTIFISPEGSDLNQTWFIGNKTTSGFTVYLNSATSSSHYCKFMVVRF